MTAASKFMTRVTITMTMITGTVIAGAAFLLMLMPQARAQTPSLLGQDQDWAAYSVEINGAKTCYVLSQPKSQSPKGIEKRRDPVYFFVTYRPKDNIANQISVTIGYPFRQDSKSAVEIGPEKFVLFTKDDKAWLEDVQEQAKLVAAMKQGSAMTVRGTSSRGTNTQDSYSLSGVTAAIGRAEAACK